MKLSPAILPMAVVSICISACAPARHYSPPVPQSRDGDSNAISVDLVFRNVRPMSFRIDNVSVCSDASDYCFPAGDDLFAAYFFTLPTYVSPGEHKFDFEVRYAPEKSLFGVASRKAKGTFKGLRFEPGYKYTCTLSATEYTATFDKCEKKEISQRKSDQRAGQGQTAAERLRELKSLYDAGLITQEVYEKRQQQILEE